MSKAAEELRKELLKLQPGDHLCCIYEDDEEHRNLLAPYLKQGLDSNQKIIYIAHSRTGRQVMEYFNEQETAREAVNSGQFQIIAASDSYLRDGIFDPDRMIAQLDKEANLATEEGYSALRVTGEMSWTLKKLPGSERLIEYEQKLNDFLPGRPIVALCQYDRRSFHADVLKDVLRTHPTVVVGLEVYNNFYFIPPAELSKNTGSEAELGHWIKNLAMHKQQQKCMLYRSKFQKMVAGISSDFIGADGGNIDEKINRMLSKAGKFFDVDRSYIFLFTNSGKTFAYSHEWCNKGIKSHIGRIMERSVEALPWWIEQTTNGRIVKIEDVEKMPEEAAAEQEEFRRQNIKSVLTVPVAHEKQMLGALGFDTVKSRRSWESNDIVLLKLLANVLAEAGYRMKAELEHEQLRKELERSYRYEDIVSRSSVMQDIFAILPDVSASNASVLIEGESGTGKELFARAIHNHSPRSEKPLVKLNCAALPETLLESELFGYKSGAFTDAKKDKPGLFTRADGGTVFLDEIGEISPSLQVKLLQVLQDGTYEPVGGTSTLKSDIRVIAATNKNLEKCVKEGSFREDLYYRINVIRLELPPLRERKEDIPLLVDHIIQKFNRLKRRKISGVSDEVINMMLSYDYPGNVRELENIFEHAFVLCKGNEIELKHLPLAWRRAHMSQDPDKGGFKTLEEMERYMIQQSLKRNDGNKAASARELGIGTRTLFRKLKKYNSEDETHR